MSLNVFDTMTFDQAIGAVMLGSMAILSIAGLIWSAVDSE
jgi:hypothetical protein